ncbi:hypothetical protein [Actinacidiphila acidipaludis]|uniref:Hpr(Ser) kinase/phosphatase n=1 Tax=Actinacidiphila acidipaludis TaxID=2873382 RepID=A0ABS7QH81_9ACTN|nr:hypothetical protein [Streptomyces acidipaludis]MBY8882034.1 hypothetical protein [Streptomyces acidipaludis]
MPPDPKPGPWGAERLFDFFGTVVRVRCTPADATDLDFFFGPHRAEAGTRPRYRVELSAGDGGFLRSLLAKDDAPKSFRLSAEADGEVIEERRFTRWSSVPSPLPPFRVLREDFAAVQATVLERGGRCLALHGAPHSGKTSLGLALLARGWALASDQLLVVERATGAARPYLTPTGVRGRTLAAMREGTLAGLEQRRSFCTVSGEVVLARPESLGAVVPVARRLRSVCLIAVRRSGAAAPVLTAGGPAPRVWPAGAWSWLSGALDTDRAQSLLTLPAEGGEQAGADIVEEYFGA